MQFLIKRHVSHEVRSLNRILEIGKTAYHDRQRRALVRLDGGDERIKAALFVPSLLSTPALSRKYPDRCFTTEEVFPRHLVIDKNFLFSWESI
jgi:hypothetical protein